VIAGPLMGPRGPATFDPIRRFAHASV